MRIGIVYEPISSAQYRAIQPARALEQRGHEIAWPPLDGRADVRKAGPVVT